MHKLMGKESHASEMHVPEAETNKENDCFAANTGGPAVVRNASSGVSKNNKKKVLGTIVMKNDNTSNNVSKITNVDEWRASRERKKKAMAFLAKEEDVCVSCGS